MAQGRRDTPVEGSSMKHALDMSARGLVEDTGDGRLALSVRDGAAPARGSFVRSPAAGRRALGLFVVASNPCAGEAGSGVAWHMDVQRARWSGWRLPGRIPGSRLHRRELAPEQMAWCGGAAAVVSLAVVFFAPVAWWMGRSARRSLPSSTSRPTLRAAALSHWVGLAMTCAFLAVGSALSVASML